LLKPVICQGIPRFFGQDYLAEHMTYRERIHQLFRESQSLLKEYSELCLKIQENQPVDPAMLQECDKIFKEYNELIKQHHKLILQVTRQKVHLDQSVGPDLL
jgi:hypothetical protein